MAGHATGFPLPTGTFSGAASLTNDTARSKKLETLLNLLEEFGTGRGIVDAPADLASIANPQDGWLVGVRESSGAGTPPTLYQYNGDTHTWQDVVSSGIPASHAATHITGPDPVAVTAPANDAIPMTPAAPAAPVLDGWISPSGVGTPGIVALSGGAGSACDDADVRLSDARAPTAHTHANADLTGANVTPANDTVPITPAGPAAPVLDAWISAGAVGTPGIVALSGGAGSACDDADVRLSDARAPTAHGGDHAEAGTDPVRLYVCTKGTRPTLGVGDAGAVVICTDLFGVGPFTPGPVYWDGSAWYDAAGNVIV
jgi:hypothetical protein